MVKLIFDKNGVTFNATKWVSGLDNFTFSRELKEDNSVVFSLSNELLFSYKAYDYLLENGFWNCPNPDCTVECIGYIRLVRCGLNIPFKLSAKDTTFCPDDCEVTGSIELMTEDNDKRDCLLAPYVSFLHDGQQPINGFQPVIFSIVSDTQDNNTNSGVVRGTRLVDALDIVTEQCGLKGWCSAILSNSIYQDLVIVHTNNNNTYNAPGFGINQVLPRIENQSIIEVLNNLGNENGPFFDYQVRIFDCKLYFEHESFFENLGQSFDVSEFDDGTKICFKFSDDKDCTSLDVKYTKADSSDIDTQGVHHQTYVSLQADGKLGDKVCEHVLKWSAAAFNDQGNIVVFSPTTYPTLVVFDGSYTNAKAIYDASCGYNYPMHLNNIASCPEVSQTFFNELTANGCKVEVKDSIELCPKDLCGFIEKLLINDIFKLDTVCGTIIPNNVEVNVSTGIVTVDDFDVDTEILN